MVCKASCPVQLVLFVPASQARANLLGFSDIRLNKRWLRRTENLPGMGRVVFLALMRRL